MNFKNIMKWLFVIAVIIALSVISATAQDLIVKQDGETIKAYRTDIGKKAVYYRLEDNDESQILSIPKTNVLIIKMKDGTKIAIDEAGSEAYVETDGTGNAIIPCFPNEPVADPEVIANVQIGSLIEFYDGSKGIVFYLDGNGHGLAVCLYENKNHLCWQRASSWRDCVDIKGILNGRNTAMQMGLGKAYCDAAIKQLRSEEIPAINWCCSIGPEWYLPSLGELYELLVVANNSKGSKGPISQALKANGGKPFDFLYLSSSEEDSTDVYSISASGLEYCVKKYDNNACRAIRMF